LLRNIFISLKSYHVVHNYVVLDINRSLLQINWNLKKNLIKEEWKTIR
jgi:hypothetical protein